MVCFKITGQNHFFCATQKAGGDSECHLHSRIVASRMFHSEVHQLGGLPCMAAHLDLWEATNGGFSRLNRSQIWSHRASMESESFLGSEHLLCTSSTFQECQDTFLTHTIAHQGPIFSISWLWSRLEWFVHQKKNIHHSSARYFKPHIQHEHLVHCFAVLPTWVLGWKVVVGILGVNLIVKNPTSSTSLLIFRGFPSNFRNLLGDLPMVLM